MKTWSTGEPDPRGDLYTDETPVKKLEDEEMELTIRFVRREAPPEFVHEALDMLGLA